MADAKRHFGGDRGNELGPQNLQPCGTLVVRPITNTTYTLTAYGPGGQTVSVTIEVFVR